MYRDGKGSWFKHLDFTIVDILCLELSFLLSYLVRHGFENPFDIPIYRSLNILIILFDICIVFFYESYSGILRRGYFIEYKCVVKHVTILIFLCFTYMFFIQKSEEFSRVVFLEMWGLSIISMYVARLGLKRYVRKRLRTKKPQRTIVALVSRNKADETIINVNHVEYSECKIVGVIVVDGTTEESIQGIPVVAPFSKTLEYLKNNVVDEVFLNISKEQVIQEEIVNGCLAMGIAVHINLILMSQTGGNKVVEALAGYTVMTTSIKMISPKQIFYKRMLDIIGGCVGMIITGILFIFVAPIIYAQSPGPIFFNQVRVGKNGRKFKIYKFRSMYMDAEERKKELLSQNEMQGNMFKMKNDPRIFPFGKFIRKLSIDEFPQFWNVLKGEMSLVGTRPPTEDEYEKYDLHHKKRLAIQPGITGLWQVSGRSSIMDFEKVVELDTRYIMNWSFAMDLKILLMTVGVVFGRKGSS